MSTAEPVFFVAELDVRPDLVWALAAVELALGVPVLESVFWVAGLALVGPRSDSDGARTPAVSVR